MSHLPRILPASILGASLVIGAALLSHAGPLDPPSGPVTPSYKTLSDVEPRTAVSSANTPGDATSMFIISKPGSYYLTGNITGLPGKSAISITSSDVTLDLAGFRLTGDAATLSGITSAQSRVCIRNGSVSSFGQSGIQLGGFSCAIESVQASSSVGDNLVISTLGSVRHCTVAAGSARGIVAGLASNVEDCRVAACNGIGIDVMQSTVTHCIVNNCGTGIVGGTACIIRDCNSQVNKGDGIRIGSASQVTHNVASSNGLTSADGAGVRVVGGDTRVEDNNFAGNDIGLIVTGTSNIILRNTCGDNLVNNYDIVAGNRYGPIINITAGGSAAAVGNAAASTLASTDPWANFAY